MKIPQNILLILEQCRVEDNILYLPDTQLDRTTYTKVNKCLENIGGKWNRKEKGHVFNDDPTETLENLILAGEITDSKKLFQFFPTPRAVAEQMVQMAELHDTPYGAYVLEPSIGRGDLADVILEHNDVKTVMGVELNSDMGKYLEGKPYSSLVGMDFLTFAKDLNKPDLLPDINNLTHIIMNPPFTRQQDIGHIQAAFSLLPSGGTLVSVASTSWQWRDNKKSVEFREWLKGLDADIQEIPEGAFKESGTMIATVIIKIKKEGVLEDKVIDPTIPKQPSPNSQNAGLSVISNIAIEKILPHPNNPRKDLGDLSELVDSIKTAGILQNLSVVPADIEDYKHKQFSKKAYLGEYITIIGHRRGAAAKLAGLTKVPCAIMDMDEKNQVATMLLENMQRSDLTLYEQAQGMQLMLDLGENIGSIAEKTGLSQRTVRRRVKLMELDKEKVKEAESRGAKITDYAELDKINDIVLKNKVLSVIGTSNFKWELNRAIETEEKAAKQKVVLEILETFAIKTDDRERFEAEYISYYKYDDFEPPKDADKTQYYYCISGTDLYLLVEKNADDEKENIKAKIRSERKNRIAKLQTAHKRAYKLRMEYTKVPPSTNDAVRHTIMAATTSMIAARYSHVDEKVFAAYFDIKDGFKPNYNAKEDDTRETFMEAKERIFERREFNESHGKNQAFWQRNFTEQNAFFTAVYLRMENLNVGYFSSNEWSDSGGRHTESKEVDKLYSYLCSIGYKMSDEEKALQDGTHELYKQKN